MPHLADTPVCRSFPRLKRIPDPLLRYAAALLLLALLAGLAFLTRFAFGFGASVLYGLFYFIAILGAAWLGYGQGLVVCTLLTYVVAPWFSTRPVRFRPIDLGRFAVLLAFSLAVSTISFLVRRRQEELMRATEDLESRVRLGTEEARRNANVRREIERSVREQAQLLDLAHDAILSLDSTAPSVSGARAPSRCTAGAAKKRHGRSLATICCRRRFPQPSRTKSKSKLLATGHWEGELMHTHRDGAQLRVSSRWALRRGADGQPARLSGNQHRHHRAAPHRRAASAHPETGEPGRAGRRRGARLQQPAHRHPGQRQPRAGRRCRRITPIACCWKRS